MFRKSSLGFRVDSKLFISYFKDTLSTNLFIVFIKTYRFACLRCKYLNIRNMQID